MRCNWCPPRTASYNCLHHLASQVYKWCHRHRILCLKKSSDMFLWRDFFFTCPSVQLTLSVTAVTVKEIYQKFPLSVAPTIDKIMLSLKSKFIICIYREKRSIPALWKNIWKLLSKLLTKYEVINYSKYIRNLSSTFSFRPRFILNTDTCPGFSWLPHARHAFSYNYWVSDRWTSHGSALPHWGERNVLTCLLFLIDEWGSGWYACEVLEASRKACRYIICLPCAGRKHARHDF